MAGSRRPGSSTIDLKPTVWIRCGSKKCTQAVKHEVEHLNYLRTFSHGPVHVSQNAPHLATQSSALELLTADMSTAGQTSGPMVPRYEYIAYYDARRNPLTCGIELEIRMTEGDDSNSTSTQRAIIGGMIMFRGRVYGLTTAHALQFESPEREAPELSLIHI